VGEFHDSDNLK